MNSDTQQHSEDFSSKEDLMNRLEHDTGVFKNADVKEAFNSIDRKDFVPGDYRIEAYEDYALPLVEGATISQPTTLAFMLELLAPEKGDSVLDVGSGSGFSTALLGVMVGSEGSVKGLELNDELLAFAKENLSSYDMPWVSFEKSKEGLNHVDGSTWDRILVSAGVEKTPDHLIKDLKIGGVLVIPVKRKDGYALERIEKQEDGSLLKMSYEGFGFVKLQ